MGSGSAWTARVLGATTSSSSGSGDRSSTRRSTSELTAPSPRPVLRSAGISTSTTHADRIRALTGGRRIEPTSPSCRRSRRPEPGRPSTYQSGKPVPTNRASSEIRDTATLCRLSEIGPRDVIEAMLAVQMVATHEAALECFRRAALSEQTFAGRELGLKYADKLVRSFAALTDALNRHRGKGQPQVVRVERVTVKAGGQAIVGAVTQGGGAPNKSED